jgi:chromosome segregation ATPase
MLVMPENADRDLRDLKADVREVKGDIGEMKTDIGEMKTDIGEIKTDIGEIKTDMHEMKTDMREVKVLVASGVRAFPADWPGEVVRLLRENNRLTEGRFAQLDVTLREQALETNSVMRAVVAELRALITRIDALIRGRRDGRSEA